MRLYHNFQLSPAKVHSILYGLEVFFSPKVGGVETVTQQGGEANIALLEVSRRGLAYE